MKIIITAILLLIGFVAYALCRASADLDDDILKDCTEDCPNCEKNSWCKYKKRAAEAAEKENHVKKSK